jgi:hypothetical protein
VGPAEGEEALRLSKRCLDNWLTALVGKLEAARIGDIAASKSFAKLCGQPGGEPREQLLSIVGPRQRQNTAFFAQYSS